MTGQEQPWRQGCREGWDGEREERRKCGRGGYLHDINFLHKPPIFNFSYPTRQSINLDRYIYIMIV